MRAPGIGILSEDFKRLVVKGKKRAVRSKFFAAKGYQEQLESFVHSVKTGGETAITAIDGTRATLGCLLILEAARTGEAREFKLNEFLT